MSTISAIPIQLQATIRSVPPRGLFDVNTGEWPSLWKGSDTVFNAGIFDDSGFNLDLSNLVSITLQIFPYVKVVNYLGFPESACLSNIIDGDLYVPGLTWPSSGTVYPPLVTVTVLAESITSPITLQRWQSSLAQNASFLMTSDDTASIDLQGQPSRRFMLCLSGSLTNESRIIYGSGPIFVYESGFTRSE